MTILHTNTYHVQTQRTSFMQVPAGLHLNTHGMTRHDTVRGDRYERGLSLDCAIRRGRATDCSLVRHGQSKGNRYQFRCLELFNATSHEEKQK